MISRLISQKDSTFKLVEQHIRTDLGRDPALLGLYKPETYVIGRFDQDKLTGFGIFEDYRDPKFHIGNMQDSAFAERARVLDNYMLYNVSLIHEFAHQEDPSETAKGVITAMHDILGIKNGRLCLFITLMERDNRQAIPFFESLGFQRAGKGAFYMEIPIKKNEQPRSGRWQFIRLDGIDPAKLAESYVKVFGGKDMDWYEALRMILATRGFDNHLSFAALEPGSKDVVGFCLLQRTGPAEVYIMAMGVTKPVRGRGLTDDGYAYLNNTLHEAGISSALFVTSSERLSEHFAQRQNARMKDRMLWYSLCK